MRSHSRFAFPRYVELLLAMILVIFTTVSIRMTEWSLWNAPAFFVNGEHLMATHDAYVWLAGTKGIGNFVADPFVQLLSLIHNYLKIPVDVIGFWSPIVFIPLLAVPISLLAFGLGLTEGALVFGILATSGIGFLVRTRLGFCDTDVLTLFFPISTISAFAIWLEQIRLQRIVKPNEISSRQLMGLAFLTGLCGKLALWFYPGSSSLLLPSFCIALLFGLLKFRSRDYLFFWDGLLVIFGLCFGGWAGALLVTCWCIFTQSRYASISLRDHVIQLVILAVACLVFGILSDIAVALLYRLDLYAKIGTPGLVDNATGLKLPDIAQSIREAQNLEWSQLGLRMGGNWSLFGFGLIGFVFVCTRKPVLLLFLPYLLFGLASIKLGNRFSMYGTVGIGAGLGLGLAELMAALKQSQARRWIVQLVLACFALWPSADLMSEVSPIPVLPQTYAQAFCELRNMAEPNALLWEWWDYGYAAQYYAERATMGDGSRHDGSIVYPLGAVHMASSSSLARNMIQYFGTNVLASGSVNTTDPRTALLLGDPLADFHKFKPADGKLFLNSLNDSSRSWPAAPPQYFVLSWENLRLAGWIGYYGNWDVESGTSTPGRVQQLSGDVRIDTAAGTLSINGKNSPVDSLDIVEPSGTRIFTWPNGSGAHVVINQFANQMLYMDSRMYSSMMVQMLLHSPKNFEKDFTLVIDKYPWARVYKVKN